ncbi:unnamed protein product (macronuclear) [Paramecium tetraurelia]|uniref:Uncharacterized protein n=1 Tax=Paramecium tetraurelia TaxID=5888 RepID=A0CSG5_PARTE|nr:uncharacterized protein GSPATT00010004001 [Paramecium tetraurelia]CAK73732.1 unnamed protein product [Paramecium tetraurelia]|eukprot:XP_001441129.1 hypothetical protein (macronuclear) [Paramecium tetraurelia strain d4-2]
MENQLPIRKKTYHSESQQDDKNKPGVNKNQTEKLLESLQKITLLDILDEFAKESENKSITEILKTILNNVENKQKEPEVKTDWDVGKQDKPNNNYNQKFESNNNFQNNKFKKRNTEGGWGDNQRTDFSNKENGRGGNYDRNGGNDRGKPWENKDGRKQNFQRGENWKSNQEGQKNRGGDWNNKQGNGDWKQNGTNNDWKTSGNNNNDWKINGNNNNDWKTSGTNNEWKSSGINNDWKSSGNNNEWKSSGVNNEWKTETATEQAQPVSWGSPK